MQTIIIDDNIAPKKALKILLNKYCPEVNIIGEASSVREGIKTIEELSPQLVFLDVEMPDGTGFDLLEQLKNTINFKVIFTTGYTEYAIRAFRFSAIDYLLKPIEAELLKIAVQKAQKEIENEVTQLKIGTLLSNIHEFSDKLKKIVLKDSNTIHIVQLNDILYLEADSNYTKFYLTEKQEILVSNTLKEYEDFLTQAGFFRCHRSYLVNLNRLKKFDKRDGGMLILEDNATIPLSSSKKEQFLTLLETL